jgi:CRP-like cAMP-binding protein
MFVMETGKIAILKRAKGHHYLLRDMVAGDCIGEMALFDFLPRSASAYVLEDARLIEISSAILMDVYNFDLEQFALIQMNMGREVTRRLRVADERCFNHRIEADIKDGNIEFFEMDNLG